MQVNDKKKLNESVDRFLKLYENSVDLLEVTKAEDELNLVARKKRNYNGEPAALSSIPTNVNEILKDQKSSNTKRNDVVKEAILTDIFLTFFFF